MFFYGISFHGFPLILFGPYCMGSSLAGASTWQLGVSFILRFPVMNHLEQSILTLGSNL